MKFVARFLLTSIALILITITALPAAAQDNDVQTLIITEAQLNSALLQAVENSARPVESMSLNLTDMEIILWATGTRPNGKTYTVEAVIVPSVADYRLYWTLARTETVDKDEAIVSPRDPATGQVFIDVWEHAFRQTVLGLLPFVEQENLVQLRSLDVLSAVVGEDAMTIEYQKGGSNQRLAPDDPLAAPAQDGTSNTLMIAEVQANDALAAFARRNERVESVTVDFTPGGVKIEAQIITQNGQTAGIIAILIGLVTDSGDLEWSLSNVSVTAGVAAGDVNGDAIGALITEAWSRFVDLQLKSTGNEVAIESLEVTNTTMIIAILIGL